MTIRAGFVVAGSLAVLSCFSDSSTGPQTGNTGLAGSAWRPTAIAFLGSAPEVSTPAGINVNDTARVSFTVYPMGCVKEIKNEITVAGLEADVRSYQLEYVDQGSEGCANTYRVETSSARITFAQPGLARIRVHGRQFPGDGPVMVERSIMVVP